MSDLNLPPRRSLPPEIRERLRERVVSGLRRPSGFDQVRAPLAAAAAVAVLAAGTLMVAQSVGDGPGSFEAGTTTSTAELVPEELDRCWNAVVDTGKANKYPDRSEWQAVAHTEESSLALSAIVADDKPIFCVTNATTVTVSDPSAEPAYAAGTRTGSLLTLPEGGIAGVADPTWARVGLIIGEEDTTESVGIAGLEHGLFFLSSGYVEGATEVLDVRDDNYEPRSLGDGVALPPAAPPAVVLVDRPATATPEGSEYFDLCMGKSETEVPTPHLWQAGAYAKGLSEVVLTRNGARLGVCRKEAESYMDFRYVFEDLGEQTAMSAPRIVGPPFRLGPSEDDDWVLMGVVPEGTSSLVVDLADQPEVTAQVANGTFTLELMAPAVDDQGNLRPDYALERAVVHGPDAEVTYDGPIS